MLAFAFIFCVLFSVSVFAAGDLLPVLPEGTYENWIVCIADGVLFACNYDKVYSISDGLPTFHYFDIYKISNDAWNYSYSNNLREIPCRYLYDSTGKYGPSSLDIFDIPRPITSDSWQSVTDMFTAQICVGTVVTVLAVAAAVGVGLFFLWWGVRKVSGALMAAFRKGRIRI